MIFTDSDAFIGLYSEDDFHHENAQKILSKLKEEKEDLVTSWDVVDEVVTKLSSRATKKIALEFFQGILKSEILIIFPDIRLVKKTLRVFKKQASKKVSLTDCTNMAIAKEKGIKKFFSFDKVYEKNGFRLLSNR